MRGAILVTDLGYGDAGKGSIVDTLTRRYQAHTVVRYNGGAQAAHNVVTPDGRHHTFAQFGSGTLIPGTRTHLSRFMLVNPISMLSEEQHLQALGVSGVLSLTSIDRDALIITPFHQVANRMREIARDSSRHGSCGMGIGETMADSLDYSRQMLRAGDLADRAAAVKKLRFFRDLKRNQLHDVLAALPDTESVRRERALFDDPRVIEDCADVYSYFASLVNIVDCCYLGYLLNEPGTVIFEGAQGVLLDEWYGFHPYTTWSTTTLQNAESLLHEQHYDGDITRLGLLRAYSTRHGAGPFVTEDAALTATIPDMHNQMNDWQREFRVGVLDLVATRYAIEVAGQIDALAVTNLDRFAELPEWKVCDRYQYRGSLPDLDTYFTRDGDVITGIKVKPAPDLDHQEGLTQRLWECSPVYETVDSQNENSYLTLLEERLGRPVTITSAGPTADDKREREVMRTNSSALRIS